MKNKDVCKGCKYLITSMTYPVFRNTCNYMDKTGTSRIKIEIVGISKDSCPCYESRRKNNKVRVVM